MPIGVESQNWKPEIYYGLVKAVGKPSTQVGVRSAAVRFELWLRLQLPVIVIEVVPVFRS